MNYIYTSTRDNSRYILDPQTTMGSRVCLVNMDTCEDKFVSPKALKRWYTLTRTEDIVVRLSAFTGMHLGLYIVAAADDGLIYLWTKSGKYLTFNPEDMTQTNANNPKFANKLTETYNYLESTLKWTIS